MIKDYNFEIEDIKKEIKKTKPKTVLLQLPDGLKPMATKIANKLKKEKMKIFIWAGSCYGSCDIPNVKVDMLVHFGHNKLK